MRARMQVLTAVDPVHAHVLVPLQTAGRHSADRPVHRAPAGVKSALKMPSFSATAGTAREGVPRSDALGVRHKAPRPRLLLYRQLNRGESKAFIAGNCKLAAKLLLVSGSKRMARWAAQHSAAGGGLWRAAGWDVSPHLSMASAIESLACPFHWVPGACAHPTWRRNTMSSCCAKSVLASSFSLLSKQWASLHPPTTQHATQCSKKPLLRPRPGPGPRWSNVHGGQSGGRHRQAGGSGAGDRVPRLAAGHADGFAPRV